MRPAVAAMLAVVPPALQRAEVARTRPGLLPYMRDWARDWLAYCAELGIGCPPSLLELATAMRDVYVHIHDEHGWDLLTPADARERRSFLGRLAAAQPALRERAAMLPIFGQDGDLLLIAADGAIHRFTRDDWASDRPFAGDFDALLHYLASGAREADAAASNVL